MDIRNWPLDRIMQLPDCCFGRKFLVCLSALSKNSVAAFDISEVGLPERCVLWELSFWVDGNISGNDWFRLALGDQLPTTAAQVDALEPLIFGLGRQGAEPKRLLIRREQSLIRFTLRMPIAAIGRRPVLHYFTTVSIDSFLYVVLLVSSIPKEVPDWLISGAGRSL